MQMGGGFYLSRHNISCGGIVTYAVFPDIHGTHTKTVEFKRRSPGLPNAGLDSLPQCPKMEMAGTRLSP